MNVGIINNRFEILHGPSFRPQKYDIFILTERSYCSLKLGFSTKHREETCSGYLTNKEFISMIESCDNSTEEKSMLLLALFGE